MTPPDLYAWRREQRRRLLAARESVPAGTLSEWRAQMDLHLQRAFAAPPESVVAFCWPYRGEHDARHVAAQWRRLGAVTVLPVVVAPKTPLVFREWHPGVRMAAGPLGIPYPEDSPERVPDQVLLPMLGWDDAAYRLGYGGGFFDRTLASLAKRPRVIGTAYELQHLESIYPQAHDIAMDFVVTERGIYRRDAEGLRFLDEPRGLSSPVCYAAEIDPGYFGETPEK